MKIIEALKKIKDLSKKYDDLKDKVSKHCADMDYETALYPDQKGQVSEWIQASTDVLKEILRLKTCLQRTNLNTNVTICVDEKIGIQCTKSIYEWILRRTTFANQEKQLWASLTDRSLKDMRLQQSQGQIVDCKVRRYYDPVLKDNKVSMLTSEPSLIDAKLEIVNATTDLIE